MPRGSKPGEHRGGRAPGVPNRATVERQLRAAAGIASVPQTGQMPLDVILQRMSDPASVSRDAFEAAVAAAPYVHPRLTAVAATLRAEPPNAAALAAFRAMSPDELQAMRAVMTAARQRQQQEQNLPAKTAPLLPGAPRR